MANNGFKITVRGVDKGNPTITIQSVDQSSGALFSRTEPLKGRKVSEVVGQALSDSKLFHQRHAESQKAEDEAMSGKYPVG